MKKFIHTKFLLLVLMLTMIFTSCSISFQKRRYRPGFHVSTNFKMGKTKRENTPLKKTRFVEELKEEIHSDTLKEYKPIENSPIEINTENKIIEGHKDGVETQKLKDKSIQVNVSSDLRDEQILRKIKIAPKVHKNKEAKVTKNAQRKKANKFTKRQLAIIIGVSLLFMAIIAAFSFPTFTSIFVLGNPVSTGANLAANSGKFIGSLFGWLGIIILDLLVSLGVYKYYRNDAPETAKKDKEDRKFDQSKLAGLSGILRLVYTLFLIAATSALVLAQTTGSVIQSYNFLNAFNSIWGWGLIVFGLHLIVLGLTYKNEGGRKWLTILIKTLLILAGIGYMVQYIGILLVPNPVAFVATIESIFMIFMIVGEIGFALWMLLKGGKSTVNK